MQKLNIKDLMTASVPAGNQHLQIIQDSQESEISGEGSFVLTDLTVCSSLSSEALPMSPSPCTPPRRRAPLTDTVMEQWHAMVGHTPEAAQKVNLLKGRP